MTELLMYFEATILFVYCCLVIYLIAGWVQQKKRTTTGQAQLPGISVIVPFRNEEENVKQCIDSLLALDYPTSSFEVLLINDHSEDESVSVVKALISDNNNFTLVNLSSETGKKAALSKGIAQAKNDLILTTDADCTFPHRWLREIASQLDHDSDQPMVVGPVLIEHNNLFERIQALDFLSLTGTMISTFGNDNPILCNGANLMFQKKRFNEVGGYNDINSIPTGDDILLMQKFLDSNRRVTPCVSLDATVFTRPAKNISEFVSQRIRWASKIDQFQSTMSKYVGLVVFGVNFSLLFSFVLSIFNSELVEFFVVPFAVKCVIDFLFLFLVASYFEERKLLWYLIITELFNMVTIPFIALLSTTKGYTWKGRQF